MAEELEFLIEIVKEAEKISKEKWTVQAKGDGADLVTNLDGKIENFLIGKIKEKYPHFDIVSEEGNYDKQVTDNCFIIDPIDGTVNFANHIPFWAIQVACRKNGNPVASVIDMPDLNEFYYADENGAFLNGRKIHVNEVPLKNTLYTLNGGNVIDCLSRMRKHSPGARALGCVAMSMAYVASGRIHGAVFRNDKPWDYEPGLYLVQMAGGAIADESGFHAGAMSEDFLNILSQETARKYDNIYETTAF